jgi:DNA-binding MarR family transcriptional regulator
VQLKISERKSMMKNFEEIQDSFFLFGSLFSMANKMSTLLDRELEEYNVTSKQWFLSVIIENFFDQPPTLKEAARVMGTSYQNVKQIALKLEDKNLMRLEKDKKDGRVIRLVLTSRSSEFWAQTNPKGAIFMKSIFKDIDEKQLKLGRQITQQLLSNIAEMEEKENEGGE